MVKLMWDMDHNKAFICWMNFFHPKIPTNDKFDVSLNIKTGSRPASSEFIVSQKFLMLNKTFQSTDIHIFHNVNTNSTSSNYFKNNQLRWEKKFSIQILIWKSMNMFEVNTILVLVFLFHPFIRIIDRKVSRSFCWNYLFELWLKLIKRDKNSILFSCSV